MLMTELNNLVLCIQYVRSYTVSFVGTCFYHVLVVVLFRVFGLSFYRIMSRILGLLELYCMLMHGCTEYGACTVPYVGGCSLPGGCTEP